MASYSLSLKTSAFELHRILEILIAQGSTSILFKNKETNEVHVAVFLKYRTRLLFHMNDTDNVVIKKHRVLGMEKLPDVKVYTNNYRLVNLVNTTINQSLGSEIILLLDIYLEHT